MHNPYEQFTYSPSRLDSFFAHVRATYAGQTVTIGDIIDNCGGDIGLIQLSMHIHPSGYPDHDTFRAVLVRVPG